MRESKTKSDAVRLLNFRAPASFKAAAEKAAKEAERSLSSWLRWLVSEELKRLAAQGGKNHVA